MSLSKSLLSGLAGAVAVTILNETARKFVSHAPRMDVIGERGLKQTLETAGVEVPQDENKLYALTLASDLASNSAYYGLIGLSDSKRDAWLCGATLGLLAGVGAAFLPERIGLGKQPNERKPKTQLLTIAWYLAGGLAAAAVYNEITEDK